MFTLRLFGAKLLFLVCLALQAPLANAVLYRVDLTYGADQNESGSLSGFIIIDSDAFDGTQNSTAVQNFS